MPRASIIPEKLLKLLKRSKKHNLWQSEIARRLKVSEGTIRYHLPKMGDEIKVEKQGRNKIVRLKK